jgi:hypothetical protein
VPRVVYRIVQHDPPTEWDLWSDEQRGKGAFATDPEIQRLRTGRSVYATQAQARRKANGMPVLGMFIAELHLPDDPSIVLERTTRSNGHHTLWGDAATLLAAVVRVVSV